MPGLSGGAHRPLWPAEVTELRRKRLRSKPPSSYNAAASEVLRRCHCKTDRASIRRWALEHPLAPDKPHRHRPKPVKRWQVQHWGALWQYDASPHHWLTRG